MLDEVQACVLQAVYTALKETEQRSTDVVPLWKLPLVGALIPPSARPRLPWRSSGRPPRDSSQSAKPWWTRRSRCARLQLYSTRAPSAV